MKSLGAAVTVAATVVVVVVVETVVVVEVAVAVLVTGASVVVAGVMPLQEQAEVNLAAAGVGLAVHAELAQAGILVDEVLAGVQAVVVVAGGAAARALSGNGESAGTRFLPAKARVVVAVTVLVAVVTLVEVVVVVVVVVDGQGVTVTDKYAEQSADIEEWPIICCNTHVSRGRTIDRT